HQIRSVIDAERQLSRDLGRDAGRDEVATHLNLTVARVDRILQFKMMELSLDETTGDRSDVPLRDRIADGSTPSPETALIRAEARASVRAALRTLGERERRVLADRFGLRGGRARSLREIGAELGLSREAIRLIEKRAKDKLRRIVRGRSGRPGPRPRPDVHGVASGPRRPDPDHALLMRRTSGARNRHAARIFFQSATRSTRGGAGPVPASSAIRQ
ncbi:MAG: sigma-70 family RNA polymerase sigma factor, partial [Candidatus Eisenbacteria bacterium]